MANPYQFTLRLNQLQPLTHDELDENFEHLQYRVDYGLAEGNTLRWNASDSKWEQNPNLIVSATGNVGIGIGINPTKKLDVDGDIQCSGEINGGTY